MRKRNKACLRFSPSFDSRTFLEFFIFSNLDVNEKSCWFHIVCYHMRDLFHRPRRLVETQICRGKFVEESSFVRGPFKASNLSRVCCFVGNFHWFIVKENTKPLNRLLVKKFCRVRQSLQLPSGTDCRVGQIEEKREKSFRLLIRPLAKLLRSRRKISQEWKWLHENLITQKGDPRVKSSLWQFV